MLPAYRPDRKLVDFVTGLAEIGFRVIVIVDDGSGASYETIFAEVSEIRAVRLLRHAANLGRGAALKSGFNHALCEFPGLRGLLTAHAAGEYRCEDVRKVAARLLEHPDSLILGDGASKDKTALSTGASSAAGQLMLRWILGQKLGDAHTGLRGIPSRLAALLLQLTPAGYDFELDMLVAAKRNSINILEEPAQTVYEARNKPADFNPIRYSMKLPFVLARFAAVSLVTALLDNLTFYIAHSHGANLFHAQLAGRSAAIFFNYWMVRRTVFFAQDRHWIAFSKYLSLVLISGGVSYAGIRFLSATTHWPLLLEKICVESLLFLANFAVERDWVFIDSENAPRTAVLGRERWATGLLWLTLLVPLLVEISGIQSTHLLSERVWLRAGVHRFEYYIAGFAALSLVFLWLGRRYFLPFILVGILACSVLAVGVVPVAAVLLFLVSSTILGKLVFGRRLEDRLAVLGGMAIWIFLMSVANRLPVHYVWTYLVALALPIAIGHRELRRLAKEWLDLFRPTRLRAVSEFAAFVPLADVMVAHWLVVLKPEVSGDGLTMHMAIPFDISFHHAFTIDFRQHVWALMPKGADWCYSILYVLGGEYAARLLNFSALAVIGILLFQVARRFVSLAVAMLMTFLFLSTPLVQLVTGSLFVENFVAAMCLGAVAAAWRFYETRSTYYLLLGAALLGTSVSLKLGAVAVLALAGPLLAWMILRTTTAQRPNRAWTGFAALTLVIGLGAVPYLDAYWRSGNPIFPYANDRFHSSYAGDEIKEQRFLEPLSWRTPGDLTFHTNRYYEGQDGSFGFQYFLFLPLTLACLGIMRSLIARSAIFIGLGSAILIGATQPNARYFYPALPFIMVGVTAALASLCAEHRRLYRTGVTVALLAGLLNLYFLPSSGWYHKDFVPLPLFSESGRQSYLLYSAPVRDIISYVNRMDPHRPVYLDNSQIAGLIPPAYAFSWHDYQFWKRVKACRRPEEFYRLLKELGIQRLIIDQKERDREVPVERFLSICARPEYSIAGWAAMQIRPDCGPALESEIGLFSGGKYDDTDPRITFVGSWRRSTIFPSSYQQTITFSAEPAAEIRFTFVGSGFDYIYTKGPNRGIAELLVDGSPAKIVDLYSADAKWQAPTRIAGLPAGNHQASIRVAGRKNVRSSGYYVDLDSVVVF